MTTVDITAIYFIVTIALLAYVACKGQYDDRKRLLDYKLEHEELSQEEYESELQGAKNTFYLSLLAAPFAVLLFFLSIAFAALFITIVFSGYCYYRHHRL